MRDRLTFEWDAVPFELPERVEGWRVWMVSAPVSHPMPDDPPLRLQVPYAGPAYWRSYGMKAAQRCWEQRVVEARCPFDAEHTPPASGCSCGVYSCLDVLDAVWRTKYATTEPFPVVGRVTMFGPQLGRCNIFRYPAGHIFEYRAGSAQIEELWVSTHTAMVPAVAAMRERIPALLHATYGVPVSLGLPEITLEDKIEAEFDRDAADRPGGLPLRYLDL